MTNDMGKKIRELRTKHGLTQEELSKQCNISLSALNKYERNERKPKLESIKKICDVIDPHLELYTLFLDG